MINCEKPFKIYAEFVEKEALTQFENCMNHDDVIRGALMPDAHCGYTLPIGGVIATNTMIFPSFCGYDIGCGMAAVKTSFKADDVREFADDIFKSIYRSVPTGFNVNQHSINPGDFSQYIDKISDTSRALYQGNMKAIGSLGGGNHFIEIGYDERENVWIIVHSGSRNFGHKVASHYMALASGNEKAVEGLFGFDINSNNGKAYYNDMMFCLDFAVANRKEIINRVAIDIAHYCGEGKIDFENMINRNHNHIDLAHDMIIHRKGATHAEEGMMGVIPGNMRDGSFIVRGKGCSDALWSSSHGAGRVLGRNQARKTLKFETFQESMVGITASVVEGTIDESPLAYKNIFEVMSNQKDMVDIVAHVKPIINIKSIDTGRKRR